MKPREFCREWLGVTSEQEQERGHKERCTELLSEITGIKKDAVDKWGKGKGDKGLDFAAMPAQYERTLAYAIALKRIAEAAYKGNPKIMEVVIEQLRTQKSEKTDS